MRYMLTATSNRTQSATNDEGLRKKIKQTRASLACCMVAD
jgi:hypothetical protein